MSAMSGDLCETEHIWVLVFEKTFKKLFAIISWYKIYYNLI